MNKQITLPQMCNKHRHLLFVQCGYSEKDPWMALELASSIALFQAASIDKRTHEKTGGDITKVSEFGCLACYKPDSFGEIVQAGKSKDILKVKSLGERWVENSKEFKND